jgi:hypothetical protein
VARRMKSVARKHTANARVQVLGLSKAGTSIEIDIHRENAKLGTLVIGRGSITWFGNNWRNGRRFSWSRFAHLMEEE